MIVISLLLDTEVYLVVAGRRRIAAWLMNRMSFTTTFMVSRSCMPHQLRQFTCRLNSTNLFIYLMSGCRGHQWSIGVVVITFASHDEITRKVLSSTLRSIIYFALWDYPFCDALVCVANIQPPFLFACQQGVSSSFKGTPRNDKKVIIS